MSATTITYSNAITKSIIFDEIYLDSSFVIDVLAGKANPSLRSAKLQIRESESFYSYLSKKNIEMWTSSHAVEEIMFNRFKIQIQKEMNDFEKRNSLPLNSMKIADFKRNYKKDYELSYNKIKSLFGVILVAINGLNIKIKIPKDFSIIHSTSKGERIARYAKCLLEHYILEANDAFHISIARCNGTKYVASNDLGFKAVDKITVLSFI
jgi:hypothetical protein